MVDRKVQPAYDTANKQAIMGKVNCMNFGVRVRQLRKDCGFTQRELANRLAVTNSYVSKVENGKLHHGDFPSEKFIHKLAQELEADEDELLLLADKIPRTMRQRIQERPDAFRQFAELDDRTMDAVLGSMKKRSTKR